MIHLTCDDYTLNLLYLAFAIYFITIATYVFLIYKNKRKYKNRFKKELHLLEVTKEEHKELEKNMNKQKFFLDATLVFAPFKELDIEDFHRKIQNHYKSIYVNYNYVDVYVQIESFNLNSKQTLLFVKVFGKKGE